MRVCRVTEGLKMGQEWSKMNSKRQKSKKIEKMGIELKIWIDILNKPLSWGSSSIEEYYGS